MGIRIFRSGENYRGTVGPPEAAEEWATDRPYGRDELRWKLETMGVHPVDAADALHAADLTRDAIIQAFRDHGVTGEVQVASYEGHDEVLFVLSTRDAAPLHGPRIDVALQQLLGKKVAVTTESDSMSGRAEPL